MPFYDGFKHGTFCNVSSFPDDSIERELLSNLIKLVGLAEFDCLDDESNVWRSALIDSRLAIEKATS